MYATNYFETMILNVLNGVRAGAPSTVYVGLFLTNPGEAGGGTEISYTGYARRAIAFDAPESMEGGIGIKNSAEITFPTAQAAAGTVTHIGIFDALTSGNMLVYGELSEAQTIEAQEAPVIVANEAKWWLSGDFSDWFKTQILNILRGTNCAGVTPHLALYNGDPDDSGTELSGGDYARLALSFTAPSAQSGTEYMEIKNSAAVQSARASSAWGTWAYTVIMSASSGGNPVFKKQKSPSKYMRSGLLLNIPAAGLVLAVN